MVNNNYCGGAELSYLCLLSKKRTRSYINAVKKTVKKDDVVLEAGTGTGILSIAAANSGAKKVYAIEQNKLLIPQLKRNIHNLGLENKIEIINSDSTKIQIPEKVDVIICEMICAGLIDEPQIPAMNHLIKFLKQGGKITPESAKIRAQLAHDNTSYYGYDLPFLHFEEPQRRAVPLTNSIELAEINFNQKKLAVCQKES